MRIIAPLATIAYNREASEVHRRLGGDPNVISYAILRILSNVLHKIELIIMIVLKPAID